MCDVWSRIFVVYVYKHPRGRATLEYRRDRHKTCGDSKRIGWMEMNESLYNSRSLTLFASQNEATWHDMNLYYQPFHRKRIQVMCFPSHCFNPLRSGSSLSPVISVFWYCYAPWQTSHIMWITYRQHFRTLLTNLEHFQQNSNIVNDC